MGKYYNSILMSLNIHYYIVQIYGEFMSVIYGNVFMRLTSDRTNSF